MISSCYAYDPIVSAHTEDRILDFDIITDLPIGLFLPGDTVTQQFTYNTYLLEHRHENLSKKDLILGFNTLLSEAGKGNFYAGDYLPKLYIKMKGNSMVNMPLKLTIVIKLASGNVLRATSKEIVVAG
jgi:hypothetical protein